MQYSPDNIINMALVGHSGSGKTVLCEAILFNSKMIRAIGSIDKGTTVSDYRPDLSALWTLRQTR
mgnify:CR=1 FL=1